MHLSKSVIDDLIFLLTSRERLFTNLNGMGGEPIDKVELTSKVKSILSDLGFANSFEVAKWITKIRKASLRLPRVEKYLLLNHFLGQLDLHFQVLPKEIFESSDERVVIAGGNWWRRYSRSIEKDVMERSGRVIPFYNLRISPMIHSEEVIDLVGKPGLFSRIVEKECLKIGFCTFSSELFTNWINTKSIVDGGLNGDGFIATSIEPEEKYTEEICEAVEWASKEKVDILILPELSICPSGRKTMEKQIQNGISDLILVVAGSFHRTTETGNFNEAELWVIQNGTVEVRRTYRKYEAMKLLKRKMESTVGLENIGLRNETNSLWLIEDVEPDHGVLILDSPIGWIGIVICKDFLETSNRMMQIYESCVDHLFVISMNPEPDANFFFRAKDFSKKQQFAVFYVNSAQMLRFDKGINLAFATLPLVGRRPFRIDGLSQENYGKEALPIRKSSLFPHS